METGKDDKAYLAVGAGAGVGVAAVAVAVAGVGRHVDDLIRG